MPPPPAQQPQLESIRRLVIAQDATRAAVTDQASNLARDAALSFTAWYVSKKITKWAEDLARQVEVLQRLIARNTDAYLSRISSEVTGKRVRPVGAVDVSSLRTGTHPGAYGRVADVYRYQQSLFDRVATEELKKESPVPPDLISPEQAAADRAASVADMDAILAVRQQSAAFMQQNDHVISGYRRVIHPELARGGSCGLCVAASTRLYHIKELLPVHGRCNCIPMPVFDTEDIGDLMNGVDLGELYQAAGDTTDSRALKKTRYRVDEHGELGPVLRVYDSPVRPHPSTRPLGKGGRVGDKVRKILNEQESALPRARELAAENPAWSDYATSLEHRVSDLRSQLH